MKFVFFVLLALFSLSSQAGRESHGLGPAGFECAGIGPYRASLVVEDHVVVSGSLHIADGVGPELPCVDIWPTRVIGDELESTAFCASPAKPDFLLELQESKAESRLKIWKREGERAQLQEILVCA